MPPKLDSAWRKLDRAVAHVDALRRDLSTACDEDPHRLPVEAKFDPDAEAVIYCIGDSFQLREPWPVVFGDAIHNMRSALDHAWWQCAVEHLRREPVEAEVRQIGFPVRKPGKNWEPSTSEHFAGKAVTAIAKRYQPPKIYSWSDFDPLGSLDRLWNIDKHRSLPVIFLLTGKPAGSGARNVGGWVIPAEDQYIDCVPVERDAQDGSTGTAVLRADFVPSPGEEVARFFVRQTGPNPDINLEPNLAFEVVTTDGWNVIDTLERFEATVAKILSELEGAL